MADNPFQPPDDDEEDEYYDEEEEVELPSLPPMSKHSSLYDRQATSGAEIQRQFTHHQSEFQRSNTSDASSLQVRGMSKAQGYVTRGNTSEAMSRLSSNNFGRQQCYISGVSSIPDDVSSFKIQKFQRAQAADGQDKANFLEDLDREILFEQNQSKTNSIKLKQQFIERPSRRSTLLPSQIIEEEKITEQSGDESSPENFFERQKQMHRQMVDRETKVSLHQERKSIHRHTSSHNESKPKQTLAAAHAERVRKSNAERLEKELQLEKKKHSKESFASKKGSKNIEVLNSQPQAPIAKEEMEKIASPMNNPTSLQEQFSMATKSQEQIQKRYKELWSWYGTVTKTIQFAGYIMEGTLRKFVEKVKFFQINLYPKRYFVIDFTQACVVIVKEKPKDANGWKTDEDRQVIPFRNVEDCYLPQKEIHKSSLPKNWQFPFYVQTTDRCYILCAKSLNERNMWMSGFRYLIASTNTVQAILKQNNTKMEEKMKERTDKFMSAQKKNFNHEEHEKKRQEKLQSMEQWGARGSQEEPLEGMELFKSAAQIRREELQKKQKNKKPEEAPAVISSGPKLRKSTTTKEKSSEKKQLPALKKQLTRKDSEQAITSPLRRKSTKKNPSDQAADSASKASKRDSMKQVSAPVAKSELSRYNSTAKRNAKIMEQLKAIQEQKLKLEKEREASLEALNTIRNKQKTDRQDHYGLQNMARSNTMMAKNSQISTARCVSNQLTQRVSLNPITTNLPPQDNKIDFYSPELRKGHLKRQEYASSQPELPSSSAQLPERSLPVVESVDEPEIETNPYKANGLISPNLMRQQEKFKQLLEKRRVSSNDPHQSHYHTQHKSRHGLLDSVNCYEHPPSTLTQGKIKIKMVRRSSNGNSSRRTDSSRAASKSIDITNLENSYGRGERNLARLFKNMEEKMSMGGSSVEDLHSSLNLEASEWFKQKKKEVSLNRASFERPSFDAQSGGSQTEAQQTGAGTIQAPKYSNGIGVIGRIDQNTLQQYSNQIEKGKRMAKNKGIQSQRAPELKHPYRSNHLLIADRLNDAEDTGSNPSTARSRKKIKITRLKKSSKQPMLIQDGGPQEQGGQRAKLSTEEGPIRKLGLEQPNSLYTSHPRNSTAAKVNPRRDSVQDTMEGGVVVETSFRPNTRRQQSSTEESEERTSMMKLTNRDQMSEVEKHFSGLSGKVSSVHVKINDEGQKVKVIKIVKPKNSDPQETERNKKELNKVLGTVKEKIERSLSDPKSSKEQNRRQAKGSRKGRSKIKDEIISPQTGQYRNPIDQVKMTSGIQEPSRFAIRKQKEIAPVGSLAKDPKEMTSEDQIRPFSPVAQQEPHFSGSFW